MTELKTLEDLQFNGNYGGMTNCEYGCQEVIRQEAIKWIKELEKDIKEHSHKKEILIEDIISCLNCHNKYAQLKWIKHFFNITEKDVK